MAKNTPQNKMTKSEHNRREMIKNINRMDREADRNDGRDTRMARDGGTNRRLRS